MAFQASICGVNATTAANVKATPPASVARSDAVSRARPARHSATSASIAGSRAKSTLCHRTRPTSRPARRGRSTAQRSAGHRRRPAPDERGDGGHRRRMRQRRLGERVPQHERPADDQRRAGRGNRRGEELPRRPDREPRPEQRVEQAGDAHRLAVRVGGAVGRDLETLPLLPQRRQMRAAEERRPQDGRTDRPRRMGVAGDGRRLPQVGLVAQSEQRVIVGEVDVAIEGDRTQVGEVVEPVALQPRVELPLDGDA